MPENVATTSLVSFPLLSKRLLEVRSVDSTVEDADIVKVLTSFLDDIFEIVPRPITQLSVVSIGLFIFLNDTQIVVVTSLFG